MRMSWARGQASADLGGWSDRGLRDLPVDDPGVQPVLRRPGLGNGNGNVLRSTIELTATDFSVPGGGSAMDWLSRRICQ